MAEFKKIAYENLLSATERAFDQIEKKEGPELCDGREDLKPRIIQYWRLRLVNLDRYVLKYYPKLHQAFREQFSPRYAKHTIGLEAIL